MRKPFRFQQTLVAQALALAGAATLLPAGAAVVASGDFGTLDPNGSFAAGVSIGLTAAGQFTVDNGSPLEVAKLFLGTSSTGTGALTVTGTGSRTSVTFADGGNIDVGSLGRGSISVLDGARFQYGGSGNNCQVNCRIFISNGAGSSGDVLVSGAGSTFSTVGGLVVGNASMFTQAADGFSYGAPGGASTAQVQVAAGGVLNSAFVAVAQPGGGTARTGNESSTGNVLIDGANSAWNVVRNAAMTGGRTLFSMATGRNTSATTEVRNGGLLRVDGSAAAGEFSGLGLAALAAGATTSNANASLVASGAGSRVQFDGGVGFINVGRGNGLTGALNINGGATVSGTGIETGLVYVNVGNGGGTGTAVVDGAGSLLRLNGRNSATNSDTTSVLGGGAFLNVGRSGGGAAGHGSMDITGGGKVVVDTLGLQLANANGQTGMYVGLGAGSTGRMNVSGAGSLLSITADSGMTPYNAIGRDGASGTLNISGGGRVEISSTHTSVPNPGATVYLPGDALLLEIGRRSTGTDNNASTGFVNVTGADSALVLGGGADSLLIVGRGAGGAGTLNISDGGSVRTTSLLVGQEAGANGVVNINGGTLVADGLLNGGPSAGQGGGVAVGRGGTGTLNVGGGALVNIGSTFSGASLSAAGSSTSPGGSGFINIGGGSTVNVNGPDGLVAIGRVSSATAAGVGQMTLSGAGTSLNVNGNNGRVLIGGMANTSGTVIVGSGATLSASSRVGVAFDVNGQTVGTGTLVVDGTVNTTTLTNGSNGYLGGNGVINGNVVNYGLMNPGNSPGRLTINGSLDNRNGTLVLEVQSLGNGLFDVDEIVLGDPTQLMLEGGVIQFQFLGDTNPLAFQAAGLFEIDSFFKELDATGAVVGLGGARLGLFDNVRYSATSATYGITNFSFSAANGATFGVTGVPTPATLALALLALGLMGLHRPKQPQV